MAKVLSIVWYKVLPAIYGGQKGIAGFNKYLGRVTSLTCLCSASNKPAEDLSYKLLPFLPNSRWQFLNPFTWRKIIRTAKQEQPARIILEHPYHGIAGWLAKKKTGALLLVHSHNIEYQRFREQGKWWWRLLRKYERWTHRKADHSFFKTPGDLEHAVCNFGLSKEKCSIIPYGIDPEEKKPARQAARETICRHHQIDPSAKILLFAGTLDYQPNADAIEFIYRNIAPALAAGGFAVRIILCGRNINKKYQYLEELTHPAVIQAGEVTDIGNYFAAADLFINPVLSGGGMQTKNLEALAHGCPVVCFRSVIHSLPDGYASDLLFTCPENDQAAFVSTIIAVAGDAPSRSESAKQLPVWSDIISRNLPFLSGD